MIETNLILSLLWTLILFFGSYAVAQRIRLPSKKIYVAPVLMVILVLVAVLKGIVPVAFKGLIDITGSFVAHLLLFSFLPNSLSEPYLALKRAIGILAYKSSADAEVRRVFSGSTYEELQYHKDASSKSDNDTYCEEYESQMWSRFTPEDYEKERRKIRLMAAVEVLGSAVLFHYSRILGHWLYRYLF